jgi:transposase
MAIGRPTKPLNVTPQEKEKLSMLARRPKSAQAIAMRARIVLGCNDGLSNGEVARRLRVTGATVCKWRERFRVERLEGLLDEPRLGAPRSISDARVEEVITKTLESMPGNSTHWSTRLMAKKTGLSQTAIVRIWRAFGLQPHRVENFKFSKDPQFVEKVRDIVGLYLNPPDRAIVLCVDEKSQVQALNRTQPILPLAPGVPARHRTTTNDMESRHCLRPWMWPAESRSAVAIDATGTRSSCGSLTTSTRIFRAVSTFIW